MSDKRRQRIEESHTRDDQATQNNAMRSLLATREGRRLMWGILSDCNIFSVPSGNNALDTQRHIGMQQIGHLIINRILNAEPRGYIAMQEDNLEYVQALEAKLQTVKDEEDDEYEV